MTDDPLHYSQGVSDEQAEKAAIQVDTYGIKTTITPSAPDEPKPETWSDVWTRVIGHLKSIVVGLFGFVDDTIQSGRGIVRGLGQLPDAAARRIASAHHKADEREDQKQAIAVSPNAIQTPASDARERLEELLLELRARGVPVRIQDLGHGRFGVFIVPPGQEDAAAELSLKAIPKAIVVKVPTIFVEARVANPAVARDEILKRPLSELGLSARVHNVLSELGITLIAELGTYRPEDLLALKGFARAALTEVRSKMAEHDLSLREDY